jgi:RNA polymerase sigma-70 factor (sigma-E family)
MNTMPKAEPLDLLASTAWDADLVDVYRVHYGRLVRLAYLLTGHAAVAEELVQDAFVATHRTGDRLRDPYLYVRRAVVNRCRSWGRRYTVERTHRPQPPDPAELAADEMWDALGALTERQRTAIVLRFYEDMPDDRIAAVLGCRQATVRSAIHRGLQSLRRVIDL